MAQWRITVFYNAKVHVYPTELMSRLKENWRLRGFQIRSDEGYEEREITEAWICGSPSGFIDESHEEIQLPGLTFSMRVREADYFYDKIVKLDKRLELGRPYYKLHGWISTICLLPTHRELLEKELAKRLPKARAIADAEAVEFNRRIDEMNKSPYVDIRQRLRSAKIDGEA